MTVNHYLKSAILGEGNEGDSGFMGHVISRLPGSGHFPIGSLPISAIGEPALFGGQMISPTHPRGAVQYLQHQVRLLEFICIIIERS